MKMIYGGKKALLLDEGREAIKSQDWDKVLDIASYDAEVGSIILSRFEEKIPFVNPPLASQNWTLCSKHAAKLPLLEVMDGLQEPQRHAASSLQTLVISSKTSGSMQFHL